MPAVIEIYSSLECPYAYLACYRLRRIYSPGLPAYAGKVRLVWRTLSLEYVNRQKYPKPLYDAEYDLFHQIEPALPWRKWIREDWEWPSSYWLASEALACAQAQNETAAFEMSWALRYGYFAENRDLSLRHEIFEVAEKVAAQGNLQLDRFAANWDQGLYKAQVIEESRQGWFELKLEGSATFLLPDGRRLTNPAVGEIDFDEERYLLRSYTPHPGDPMEVYREMLASVK